MRTYAGFEGSHKVKRARFVHCISYDVVRLRQGRCDGAVHNKTHFTSTSRISPLASDVIRIIIAQYQDPRQGWPSLACLRAFSLPLSTIASNTHPQCCGTVLLSRSNTSIMSNQVMPEVQLMTEPRLNMASSLIVLPFQLKRTPKISRAILAGSSLSPRRQPRLSNLQRRDLRRQRQSRPRLPPPNHCHVLVLFTYTSTSSSEVRMARQTSGATHSTSRKMRARQSLEHRIHPSCRTRPFLRSPNHHPARENRRFAL